MDSIGAWQATDKGAATGDDASWVRSVSCVHNDVASHTTYVILDEEDEARANLLIDLGRIHSISVGMTLVVSMAFVAGMNALLTSDHSARDQFTVSGRGHLRVPLVADDTSLRALTLMAADAEVPVEWVAGASVRTALAHATGLCDMRRPLIEANGTITWIDIKM